jgi:hypothetical protein
MSGAARFFWVVSMAASVVAVVFGVGGVASANGAPQEAAVAAIACLIAIAPYCMARAVDELTRPRQAQGTPPRA